MAEPLHHFPDDLLRGFAVGAASEGAGLAVACHLAFCPTCRRDTAAHEATLDVVLRGASHADAPPPEVRRKLLAGLANRPELRPAPPSGPPKALPPDMPALPAVLMRHLAKLDDLGWHTLVPGIRAVDLGITSAWRARLVSFRPGIAIPLHDHGGPEHTVVFSGGLDDPAGHLGRGDAATMMPGQAHQQRSSPGEPCVAMIINESPARPKTIYGRMMKWLTRS